MIDGLPDDRRHQAVSSTANDRASRNRLNEQVERWADAVGTGDNDAVDLLGDLLLWQGREVQEKLEELYCQTADAGDIDRIDRLRYGLLRVVSNLPRDVSRDWVMVSLVEKERWYIRATYAGSTSAMMSAIWMRDVDISNILRRHSEEPERWLHTAAQMGSRDAMIELAELLNRQGCSDEAEQWLHQAIDAGSLDAMKRLAELLESQGRLDEAEQWLGTAFHDGASMPELIVKHLASLCERDGRQAAAERWLRTASDENVDRAMIGLAELLERQGRLDEAEQWLRRAIDAGVTGARSFLNALLKSQGRAEEKDQLAANVGWSTIVTTAVITSAVVPFVQTLVTKAAEDSYAAARALVRNLLRKHGKRKRQWTGESHVVVKDPHRDVALEIPADVSDDALRALAQLDLEQLASRRAERGPVRISFNRATGAWEILD